MYFHFFVGKIYTFAVKLGMTMKRFFVLYFLLAAFVIGISAQKIRVACIGNSITYGHGIEDREHDTYPAQLQQLLGDEYDVRNFGVSGTTAQKEGDFPWVSTQQYKDALDFMPQIAVIKLGTNDSKPQNWVNGDRVANDIESIAKEFAALSSHPSIIIALPAKAYEIRWNIHDSIIVNYEIPAIKRMVKSNGWYLLDLYHATTNIPERFPDGIHPDVKGAGVIAKKVCKAILKVRKRTN